MDYTSAIAELLSRHGFRRFKMSRTGVGHLLLAGRLDGRPIDIVLDTGAGKTFVELNYCRSEGIAVCDTGDPGAPAAGAGPGTASNVHTLGDVRLTLEGLPVRTDGIFAIGSFPQRGSGSLERTLVNDRPDRRLGEALSSYRADNNG